MLNLKSNLNSKTTNNKISNSIAPNKTGASFISNIVSAVNVVTNSIEQSKTNTNTIKQTVNTSNKSVIHYQTQINQLDSFMAYFDNANNYLNDAINKLKEGLIVNDTAPFDEKTDAIKTRMNNLRNSLKTEIIPELSKSR